MINKKIAKPQYITNESGKRISVVLDIRYYNALTEELEDLHDTLKAERRLTKTKKVYTLAEVKKQIAAKISK